MGRGEYGRTGSSCDHGGARVGGSADEDLAALANLRTFRGKLNHWIETGGAPHQIYLWIDARPPSGGGTLGGNDQYLTLDNLGVVNWSLVIGGEAVIPIERTVPNEWRSETELGSSKESVVQLHARVSRAIDHILARVHAQASREREIVGTDQKASSSTPWWKIAIGVGAVVGVGYLALVRPSIRAGERRLAEARKLASDVGLKYGMTDEEVDRAFDAYYKKRGYPSYLLSTARKVTT